MLQLVQAWLVKQDPNYISRDRVLDKAREKPGEQARASLRSGVARIADGC